MSIDENKYLELFTTRFKIEEALLQENLVKFFKKYGDNDKNKLSFFQIQFRKSIEKFKKELPKNRADIDKMKAIVWTVIIFISIIVLLLKHLLFGK